jgi:DNA-binding CsgD family transcriptional regulator
MAAGRAFVGRAGELGQLDLLLTDVLAGRGRTLVVRGDAGIGKTTLLDALVERCGDHVTVLRARGVETEADLAFSALSDLLAPVVGDIAVLPAPQSAALAAALALGPPAPGDRFALCVATLGLLRAAAGRRPVVAVIDDVQWLDSASRECVLYAARRAGASVAVALAIREPWDDLGFTGLSDLPLAPFDGDASLDLLGRVAPDLAPPVAAALAEAAEGNPLALVELPATLTPDQRAGVAGVELPFAPGSRLCGAFAGRIQELDALARRALLVLAVHAGDDMSAVSAACREAGTDAGRLAQGEERGLVRLGAGKATFSHPIVRGAVYHSASPADRRCAHRALAGVLAGEPRVWHLAAAAVGVDEGVAAELERVAGRAAGRRAFTSATAALERAACLSPDPEAAAGRLLAAGRTAGAAGQPYRALALLARASDVADGGDLRARAEHLRGQIMVWTGRPAEATSLLVVEAERAAGHDRVLAATMLADAANGCTHVADVGSYHRAEALVRRAVSLLGDRGDLPERASVLAMFGWVLLMRGKAPEARPVLREAEHLAQGLDELGPHWPWLLRLRLARIPLGELEQARDESLSVCERAREAGALTALGGALVVAADAAVRLGDWDLADDTNAEAIRVAGDIGQPVWQGLALTTRARLAAARGLQEESRGAALAALGIAESEGISSGLRFVHGTLGFLELSSDRVGDAIAQLETVDRMMAGSGQEETTFAPWAPDLIEAYVRSGRGVDARRVLAMLERQAASSGSAFAGAAAARCRGMLEEDFEPAFAEALALDDRRPMPFERARTLLALGRRLHRARRRAEARTRLREALTGFERLGAAAWAAQTQNELRAAGARRRAAPDSTLSPQELRVAAAVRRGASNREIAAELFLAPKTIEFHLRQIYRKLGVRSRTQLVAALAQGPVGVGDG